MKECLISNYDIECVIYISNNKIYNLFLYVFYKLSSLVTKVIKMIIKLINTNIYKF